LHNDFISQVYPCDTEQHGSSAGASKAFRPGRGGQPLPGHIAEE
jgi:hypothetical protein